MDWNKKLDLENYEPISPEERQEIQDDLFSFFSIYNIHPLDVSVAMGDFIDNLSDRLDEVCSFKERENEESAPQKTTLLELTFKQLRWRLEGSIQSTKIDVSTDKPT